MKYLLSENYSKLLYRIIPEAKERDDAGNRRRRLDILIRNHQQPSYGFELLVQGDETEIDNHLKKSEYYCQLHSCHAIYMINLTDDTNVNYYGNKTYAGVIPLHVIYNQDEGTALIKYEDHEEQVSFKGASWKIVFEARNEILSTN